MKYVFYMTTTEMEKKKKLMSSIWRLQRSGVCFRMFSISQLKKKHMMTQNKYSSIFFRLFCTWRLKKIYDDQTQMRYVFVCLHSFSMWKRKKAYFGMFSIWQLKKMYDDQTHVNFFSYVCAVFLCLRSFSMWQRKKVYVRMFAIWRLKRI